jgi:hypothetical protein
MLKNPLSMKGIFHRKNETAISRQVSPASLVDVSAGNCLGALVDKLGMIRIRWGRTIDQKWSQCMGHLVRSPRNSNNNSVLRFGTIHVRR